MKVNDNMGTKVFYIQGVFGASMTQSERMKQAILETCPDVKGIDDVIFYDDQIYYIIDNKLHVAETRKEIELLKRLGTRIKFMATTELTKEYIEIRIGSEISDKAFDVLKGRYEDLNLSIEAFGDYCYMLNKRFKFLFNGKTISEMIDKIF